MDFNQFDSRSPADEGRPLHLKHPATGKPLYDNPEDATVDNGKPCRVVVRGSEGRAAQKAIRDAVRARTTNPEDDEDSVEFQHTRLVEVTAPLVIGFENVFRGEEPAEAPKDISWFLNLQITTGRPGEKCFAEQIADFSMKRANYLGNSPSAS